MVMRTPLKVARQLGSAREGTGDFIKQRVTGLANAVLGIYFVWLIASLVGADLATVKKSLSHPLAALALMALIISGTIHMRIGMQVIIEDYVHDEANKIGLLLLNTFFSFAVALASVFAILKLSFGT